MAGIRLEFAQFGHFDSFDVIRSMVSMASVADEDLPTPIATGLKTMYYVDANVIKGQTYFYKVRVWRGSASFLSGEVIVQAGDDLFDFVELLVFADADAYPSTTFTDSSPKARAITARGGIKKVQVDGQGWIHFDNTGDYRTSNQFLETTLQSALLSDDFTVECFVKPEYGKTTQYGRFFAIGTHSTNGMLSISKSGDPWTLNIDTYSNDWGAATKVSSPPSLQNGQIAHVCLIRKAGIFYLFVNGVLAATKSDLLTFSLNQTNVFIGSHPFNNGTAFDSFGGFMSPIRLTRFARYSESGFMPPTIKFPNV